MQFIIHKLDREWAGQQVRALGGALEAPVVNVNQRLEVEIGGIAWLPEEKLISTPAAELKLWDVHETGGTNRYNATKEFVEWLAEYGQLSQEALQ